MNTLVVLMSSFVLLSLAQSVWAQSRPHSAIAATSQADSSGPSFDDTVKWIQDHIGEAGFPETTDTWHELITKNDDAPYAVHFNGCVMQLSLSTHSHVTDTQPLHPGDQTEMDYSNNVTFKLPLDKLEERVQSWPNLVKPPWQNSYSNVNGAFPAVIVFFSEQQAGSVSGSWSTNDDTSADKGTHTFVDKPIGYGDWTSPAVNGFGNAITIHGMPIMYTRPGTEDATPHMAAALNHLIDLCKRNPNQGAKDLF